MLKDLPLYISITFGLTTILTLYLFFSALQKSADEKVRRKARIVLIGMIIWLLLQAVLTWQGVYRLDTSSIPPKILLFGVFPMLLVIVFLFLTRSGRQFIDSLPLLRLTWIHVVRIPVELVLFGLYMHKTVPELMTFEGRNFDIIAGITAPLIVFFALKNPRLNSQIVLLWNFICLGLLLNIVLHAVLSAPSPFQQFAFDQPNIAILHFPFSWLPTFVVPVVLFAHLAAIRKILYQTKK